MKTIDLPEGHERVAVQLRPRDRFIYEWALTGKTRAMLAAHCEVTRSRAAMVIHMLCTLGRLLRPPKSLSEQAVDAVVARAKMQKTREEKRALWVKKSRILVSQVTRPDLDIMRKCGVRY